MSPQRGRALHGKERMTLTPSFLLLSPPPPQPGQVARGSCAPASGQVSPCRGPACSAYLPARGPAGSGLVSEALPLPVIPRPALSHWPPLPSSAVTCPQLLWVRDRLCLLESSL